MTWELVGSLPQRRLWLWMRRTLRALPLLLPLLAPAIGLAAERELDGSIYAGFRAYNEELGFNDEVGYGGRLLMRIDDRFGVGFDFEMSNPVRVDTGKAATISAMRALVRVDVVRSDWRPYVYGGLGFILFDFGDAPNTAMGLVTGGVGLERRLGEGWFGFGEGSAEMYRSEEVTAYYLNGAPAVTEPRSTEFLGSVVLGVGRRF